MGSCVRGPLRDHLFSFNSHLRTGNPESLSILPRLTEVVGVGTGTTDCFLWLPASALSSTLPWKHVLTQTLLKIPTISVPYPLLWILFLKDIVPAMMALNMGARGTHCSASSSLCDSVDPRHIWRPQFSPVQSESSELDYLVAKSAVLFQMCVSLFCPVEGGVWSQTNSPRAPPPGWIMVETPSKRCGVRAPGLGKVLSGSSWRRWWKS